MKKTVIAAVLCAIAILIGLSLPKITSNAKDEELNGAVMRLDEIEGNVNIKTDTHLRLSDKIRIIGASDTSYVGIEYGKYRNEKDVIAAAVEFAGMLNGMYINDEDVAEIDNNCTVTAFVVSENYGAGSSFICWNVTVTFGKNTVGFDIDDETGKVLKSTRILPEQIGVTVDEQVEESVYFVANQLAEYYGYSFSGLDYPYGENSGKWTMRFEDGNVKVEILLYNTSYGWVINDINYEESDEITDDAEISIN